KTARVDRRRLRRRFRDRGYLNSSSPSLSGGLAIDTGRAAPPQRSESDGAPPLLRRASRAGPAFGRVNPAERWVLVRSVAESQFRHRLDLDKPCLVPAVVIPLLSRKGEYMAKNLAGTKTHENLKAAFAGESQANRRYLYFAKNADVEGHPDLA